MTESNQITKICTTKARRKEEHIVAGLLGQFGPLGDLSVRDLQSDDLIVAIGTQPLRIDIITDIDAVMFEEAWQTRDGPAKRFSGRGSARIGRLASVA